jgi:hypothetical protein
MIIEGTRALAELKTLALSEVLAAEWGAHHPGCCECEHCCWKWRAARASSLTIFEVENGVAV